MLKTMQQPFIRSSRIPSYLFSLQEAWLLIAMLRTPRDSSNSIDRWDSLLPYSYDLATKLKMMRQVFDLDAVGSVNIDQAYIKKYYAINKFAYALFHNLGNSLHMAISRDGIYKYDDLFEQARVIQRLIAETSARQVVELGSGRGANSIWLASRNTDVRFTAIDFSDTQTALARRDGRGLSNFCALLGSYQNLSAHYGANFDIAFSVEALCHSPDKTKALSEIAKTLSDNGALVVFDGYRSKPFSTLSGDEILAARLVEKGMAVDEFETLSDFNDKATAVGLELVHKENLSNYVMPTMKRFEALAGKFFRRPRGARMATTILPDKFTFNAISGFLMPTLMELGVSEYWVTTYSKRRS